MVNTSYCMLHFFLFTLLSILTLQQCPANLQLTSFYKYSVSLEMMTKGIKQAPASTKYMLFYAIKYPSQFLNKHKNTNINSLLSNMHDILDIQKQQINNFPIILNYKVKQYNRPTGLQISTQSNNFRWKTLQISIIVFTKQIYTSLTSGYIQINNPQSRISLTTKTKLSYPYVKDNTKSLIFINGIHIVHTRSLDYQFQVNVKDSISFQSKEFVVEVIVGESTRLVQIYVGYIVFALSESQYQVSGMYVGLYDLGIGAHNFYLGNDVSATTYFFAGISSFKFKKGPGQFKILINQKYNSANVVQVALSSPITFLNTAVFRIGNKAKNICKSCPKFAIQHIANSTTCVANCQLGVSFKDPLTKIESCLICPSQLNYGIINGKCSCLNGFTSVNGQCLNSVQVSMGIGRTFSVSNADCIDPNSYKSGGSCICKHGYRKQPSKGNSCTSICTSGYFNGQTCINCVPGTYPWEQLQTCLACSRDCISCKSEYTCQQCTSGFKLTSQGQCKQICGDGLIIYDQCDDGNVQDGDGCSSQCKIQNGFNCARSGGRSFCQTQAYKITRKTFNFTSGSLIVQYQMKPTPLRLYSSSQLQQIIKIKFLSSPPYQSYLTQNPTDISIFRFVASYGGNIPVRPAIIDVDFMLPNGNLFKQRLTQNFRLKKGRMFSRALNDILN